MMHFLGFICVKMHDFCVNAIPVFTYISVVPAQSNYAFVVIGNVMGHFVLDTWHRIGLKDNMCCVELIDLSSQY